MRNSRVHVRQDLRPRLFRSAIRPHVVTIRRETYIDDPLFRRASRRRSDRTDIVGLRVRRPARGDVVALDQGCRASTIPRFRVVGEKIRERVDRRRSPPRFGFHWRSGSSDGMRRIVHVPFYLVVPAPRRRLTLL